MIKARLEKTSCWLDPDTIDEKASDSALRLLSMYDKKPDYIIKVGIANRLRFDVVHFMYGRKVRQAEVDHMGFDRTVDPTDLTQDPILSLDTTDLYHLSQSTYYRHAVLAIAQAKGKRYCKDRAQELRYVFLMLRKGVEPNAKRTHLRHHRPRGHGSN
jgi:hypothetical protein